MNYVCPHCRSENMKTIAQYKTFNGIEEINWCIDCGTIDRMFKDKHDNGFVRQGFQVPSTYESTEIEFSKPPSKG
jgi:Zn ribbon nucleic-acid-binding protein